MTSDVLGALAAAALAAGAWLAFPRATLAVAGSSLALTAIGGLR